MGKKSRCQNMKSEKFIDICEVFHVIKMELLCDGMNIETKKLPFIFQKKIEEGTIISFENHEDESLYLLGTLLVKISGMEMVYV